MNDNLLRSSDFTTNQSERPAAAAAAVIHG